MIQLIIVVLRLIQQARHEHRPAALPGTAGRHPTRTETVPRGTPATTPAVRLQLLALITGAQTTANGSSVRSGGASGAVAGARRQERFVHEPVGS